MKKKKITRLLNSLTVRELGQFGVFLEAEYFSGDEALIRYYDLLRTHVLEGESEVDEEAFIKLLFPEGNLDYKRMSRLSSTMVGLLYKFLAVEFLEEDDLRSWSLVLDALEQRKQEEPLALTLAAMERSLRRAPESANRLLQRYRMLEIQAGRPPGSGRQSVHVTDKEVRQALEGFYELARLRLDCSTLNRNLVFGESRPKEENLAGTKAGDTPSLADLYQLVRANLEQPGDADRYRALADALSVALEAHSGTVTFDLREICHYALNGCVRLLNLHPGKQEPREMLRRLYDELLEAGVVFEKDLLPPWHFKNMIQNLVLLGDADTAFRRIEEFQAQLLDDYQQNAVVFARGYLAFHTGRFHEAKDHFNSLLKDYKDIFYGLDGRVMLLRSLFELEEIELLQNQQDSARVFLHRLKGGKAVSEAHLQLYKEAVRHITVLANIYFGSPNKKLERLEKFEQELRASEALLHKDWFLEKAKG